MQNHNHHENGVEVYSLKDFAPLIVIFLIIIAITYTLTIRIGVLDLFNIARNFMGVFFLVFGLFKVVNIKGFANAYQQYDIIAKRSRAYGYLYPFIELGLGAAYLTSFNLPVINIITIVVMLVGAYGVFLKLKQKEVIPCACLGVVFKIPMTWVTLGEDLLMAFMALGMIVLM